MTVPLQRPYLASYCMIRADDEILVQRRFNTGYLDGHWALNALPQPLAGYIGVALDCLKGINPRHGSYYCEGWP